jgi:hypothetical protein
MTIIVKLIADNAFWLYLFLVLVAFLFLRAYVVARRERENAIFTLERESATGRMMQATTGLVIAFVIIGGVFYVSQVLVAETPLPEVTPTPTVLVVLPPSPTPPPLLPTPTMTPTSTPRPQPTPVAPVETSTPEPTQPAVSPPACPNPGVRLSEPGDGAVVSGVIQLVGSANIPNFEYYKFEFRGNGFGDWTFIQRFNTPISGGILGAWDTRSVASGEYQFRLVVVDQTGNYPTPCVLRLVVQN